MLIKLVLLISLFATAYGQCGKVLARGLNATMEKFVVNMHNKFRESVAKGLDNQPPAANLYKMVYDKELASQAATVANTCKNAHIFAIINGTKQGQNLYMSYHMAPDPEPNWEEAFENWVSERKDFTYPDKKARGKVTNHYTTVVWAVNFKIGCSYIYFQLTGQSMPYRKFYGCNYGPKSDNVQGEAPYRKK